jgi:NADH dehydrogenase
MIYLMKVPGFNRKLRIALDWIVAMLFQPDLVQVRFFRGSSMMSQHFEPGEIIFNQGDIGDKVYVIEKGECEVLRETGGEPVRLATLGKGDYFGEMAVLQDVSRNATVKARTAMDVVLIEKHDFNLLKAGVPAFGQVFQDLARARSAATSKNPSGEEAPS